MELDSIHFYVRDADRTRAVLIEQMGLQSLDNSPILVHHQSDPSRTLVHWVGNSELLFSIASPLDTSSPVAEYLQLHPSGVKDVSFRVLDLAEIRSKVDRLGVTVLAASADLDECQWLRIRGWGSVEHTIIQSQLGEITSTKIDRHEPITGIDHIVLNVAAGELDLAANWYRDIFDFQVEQTFDIQTLTSGLASKALVSACGKIRFNINEPSSSNSQIQEFLDLNHGAGIQHIALQTQEIWTTIDRMQQQKLAFLPIPQTYYTNLQNRARLAQQFLLTNQEWQQLERLQILMDWSMSIPKQILLQIFTQPIFESPTFFFEIIERRNRAQGFGQGNFQALFEAIEEYNSTLSI
ncbi:4-hydroxyphenylpyruvate dioxygenase [Chamaesiphon sp. OTE_8_metabat_110]|uniref:4-hydroxyphenylpyruvate dioxygenase n=1 Tax=Chamaesiphon sp. OTE_8_metabat_110 TaxID=2964696 RepID=UPI00286B51F9|nr:4-hydroxyphenylpyruvate dioxygenase [Chamaesiphon sp. OTE_8_metabat_110]